MVDQREHPRSVYPNQSAPTAKQLKSDCELEYQRFKLKALYLLISYQWVTGEAAELGVSLNKTELTQQLKVFKAGRSERVFREYLKFTRASLADVLVSLEMAQLATKVEEKVAGVPAGQPMTGQGERALAQFGLAYKRKWLARTDCSAGYVVPICRQYKKPKVHSVLVPPSVPLTGEPAGG